MANFAKSTVEDAALAWVESLGCLIRSGPEIALGKLGGAKKE